jgi:hypothetical protein
MTSKSYEHIRDEVQRKDGDEKADARPHVAHPDARQSELAVSRQGMNQESDQHKHNRPEKGAPKH